MQQDELANKVFINLITLISWFMLYQLKAQGKQQADICSN